MIGSAVVPRIRRMSYAAVERVMFGRGRAPAGLVELRGNDERSVVVVVGCHVGDACASAVAGALGAAVAGTIAVGPDAPAESGSRIAAAINAGTVRNVVVLGDETAIEAARAALLALEVPAPALLCAPTDLSGAEFTGSVEIVGADGLRGMRRDPSLYARAVLLDADLTVATPADVWAASGLRLLDHAVERILSTDHLLLIDTRLVAGIRVLAAHLAPSLRPGPDLAARREPLLGALWLVQSTAGAVRGGFSHSLSRELRARYGLALAAGSSVFVPAVVRWCADAAPERIQVLCSALGMPAEAEADAVAARLAALVAELDLPSRLRDLGVPAGDLDEIAASCFADPNAAGSPWRPLDAHQFAAKLREVW